MHEWVPNVQRVLQKASLLVVAAVWFSIDLTLLCDCTFSFAYQSTEKEGELFCSFN